MDDGVITSLREKLDTTQQTARFAYHLKRYVNGKEDAATLLELQNNRLRIGGGDDTVPFRTRAWGQIIRSMIDLQGPAAVVGVKEGYKSVGEQDAQLLKKIFSTDDLGKLLQLWIDLGYVDIIDITLDDTSITLTDLGNHITNADTLTVLAENSFSVRSATENGFETDYPICILGPPYAAGFLESWTGRPCSVTEDTCQGMGDDHCTWHFTFDNM